MPYQEFAHHAMKMIGCANHMAEEYERRLAHAYDGHQDMRIADRAITKVRDVEQLLKETKEELASEKKRSAKLRSSLSKKTAALNAALARVKHTNASFRKLEGKLELETSRLLREQFDSVRTERLKVQKEMVAKAAAKFEKVRRHLDEQEKVQYEILELDQITTILEFIEVLREKGTSVPRALVDRVRADHAESLSRLRSMEVTTLDEGDLTLSPTLLDDGPLISLPPAELASKKMRSAKMRSSLSKKTDILDSVLARAKKIDSSFREFEGRLQSETSRLLREQFESVLAERLNVQEEMVAKVAAKFEKVRRHLDDYAQIQNEILLWNNVTGILGFIKVLLKLGTSVPQDLVDRARADHAEFSSLLESMEVTNLDEGDLTLSPTLLDDSSLISLPPPKLASEKMRSAMMRSSFSKKTAVFDTAVARAKQTDPSFREFEGRFESETSCLLREQFESVWDERLRVQKDMVAKAVAKFEKVRNHLDEQAKIQYKVLELNEVKAILEFIEILRERGTSVPRAIVDRVKVDHAKFSSRLRSMKVTTLDEDDLTLSPIRRDDEPLISLPPVVVSAE